MREAPQQLIDAPALPADPRRGTGPLTHSALGVLEIDLLIVETDRVVARIAFPPASPRSLLLVLAESAASTAAGFAVGVHRRAFGAELNAHHLAHDVSLVGPLLAEATPLLTSSTRHTWRVEVIDAAGTHALEARCTLGIVDSPA